LAKVRTDLKIAGALNKKQGGASRKMGSREKRRGTSLKKKRGVITIVNAEGIRRFREGPTRLIKKGIPEKEKSH